MAILGCYPYEAHSLQSFLCGRSSPIFRLAPFLAATNLHVHAGTVCTPELHDGFHPGMVEL